jgi:hypothetical protein
VSKYAKIDGTDTYKRLVGSEILALEEKASQERKQLSIQKKALQLSAGN